MVAVHGDEGCEGIAGMGSGGLFGMELIEAGSYYGGEGGFAWSGLVCFLCDGDVGCTRTWDARYGDEESF